MKSSQSGHSTTITSIRSFSSLILSQAFKHRNHPTAWFTKRTRTMKQESSLPRSIRIVWSSWSLLNHPQRRPIVLCQDPHHHHLAMELILQLRTQLQPPLLTSVLSEKQVDVAATAGKMNHLPHQQDQRRASGKTERCFGAAVSFF
jgi:hypothetical protein